MANNDALNLRVIMGTTITPIRVKKDLAVPFILDELRARNPDRFRDVRMGPYMLHLLKTPIPIPKNIKDAGFISACFDPTNWTVVDERYDVDDLFEEPPPRKHIHLVIAIGDKTEIERGLAQHQAQLYKLLQVSVQELGRWTAYDVEDNGGRWIRDWSQAPQALKETVIKLKLKRNYVPTFATAEIQEAQRILGPQFQNVFNESWETQPNSVKSPGEFKVFSAAISLFVEEYSQRVKLDRSPALKASVFASFLIIPPAFESEIDHLVSYKQDLCWPFPIFVRGPGRVLCTFTPKSDLNLVSISHGCHHLIVEVISTPSEEDRYRTLIQAIIAARIGKHLMKPGTSEPFVVMAIYLDASPVAQRFLVTSAAAEVGGLVHIVQDDFDLTTAGGTVDFLMQMYNFLLQAKSQEDQFDGAKREELKTILEGAKGLPTLTSQGKREGGEPRKESRDHGPMPPIGEQPDYSTVFHSEEVRRISERMQFRIVGVAFLHRVAIVEHGSNEIPGVLKFIQAGAEEIEILQHLAHIESPNNHTVRPLEFWPVQGGTIVSMPDASVFLDEYDDLEGHLLSLSQQLLDGIAFMHRCGIAHLDVKPQNLLVDPGSGRLTIIDYSVSERAGSMDLTITGFSGTEGWAAPEVGPKPYSPLGADLWSCGKVIQRICGCCMASVHRDFLLWISSRLMHGDPHQRPRPDEVLQWMSDYINRNDRVESSRPTGVLHKDRFVDLAKCG